MLQLEFKFCVCIVALFSAFGWLDSNILNLEKNNFIPFYSIWGCVGGYLSGLLGIGGGVVMVPILNILLKFPIHKAIGTSMAFIAFASAGGIITYLCTGIFATGLPQYSIGYINIVQLVALTVTSIPMSHVGVKAAHRLPEKKLRYLFIIL